MIALSLYGFVATLQGEANFGRILAAHGGVFVAASLAWGMVVDGFRPDRYDVIGAAVCFMVVAVIMYAPPWGLTMQPEASPGNVPAGANPQAGSALLGSRPSRCPIGCTPARRRSGAVIMVRRSPWLWAPSSPPWLMV